MKAHIELPQAFGATTDRDVLQAYSADPLHVAMPDAVVRPKNVEEVSRILAYCNEKRIPVTACGNQTSLTAAAITDQGILMSSERLDASWRIEEDTQMPGRWLAFVGVAANLAAFQDDLAAQGFFYPPDPTSRAEVMVGATVATNASGEDSFKYGSTRRWVRGLQYVRADGEVRNVMRDAKQVANGSKNSCGLPIRDSEVDLLIGSEGTLGILTQVIVEVLPKVPDYVSMLVFLNSEQSVLSAVQQIVAEAGPELRCCEYMDNAALDILREHADDFSCPDETNAVLYLKAEFEGDSSLVVESWYTRFESLFSKMGTPHLADAIQVFEDPPGQRRLREWRHLVPATINERAARFRDFGGGKVSSDWYVPVDQIAEMMAEVRRDQGSSKWIVFGHIGNGHPHFNFIAEDLRQYQHDRMLLFKHCEAAVRRGGGVSAEHGIGKKKAKLLETQYSASEVQEMLAVKKSFDPNRILAPGNIFAAHLWHR